MNKKNIFSKFSEYYIKSGFILLMAGYFVNAQEGESGCTFYATFHKASKSRVVKFTESNGSIQILGEQTYPYVFNGLANSSGTIYGLGWGGDFYNFDLSAPAMANKLKKSAIVGDAGDIKDNIYYAAKKNSDSVYTIPLNNLNGSGNLNPDASLLFSLNKPGYVILDLVKKDNMMYLTAIASPSSVGPSIIFRKDLSNLSSPAFQYGNPTTRNTGITLNHEGEIIVLQENGQLAKIDQSNGQAMALEYNLAKSGEKAFDLSSDCYDGSTNYEEPDPSVVEGTFGIRAKKDVMTAALTQFIFIKESNPLVDINGVSYYTAVPFGANPGGLGVFNSIPLTTDVCVALNNYVNSKYNEILNPNPQNKSSRDKTVKEMKKICQTKLGKTYSNGLFSINNCLPITIPGFDPLKTPFIHRKHDMSIQCD